MSPVKNMKLIDEYFSLEKEYQAKYGVNTFLLFQVGSFFEVYGLEDKHTRYISRFSEICHLAIANKKTCVGKHNVIMCGFRDFLLEKYIEKVQPFGYSVVVFIQEEGPDGKIQRKEYCVFSPGTIFMETSHSLSNNISCVWIQRVKTIQSQTYVFGLSNIDILNGVTNLCEYYENYYHNPTTYDSIEKFLNIYNPIEIIFIHNVENEKINSIIQFLNLNSKKNYIIDLNETSHSLTKQALNCESQVYQNEILNSFYPNINKDVLKYSLDDKPICFQSFCFLLNFVQQHNVSLVHKIKEPSIENIQTTLVCANHSLKQLNFIQQNSIADSKFELDADCETEGGGVASSVIGLLNKCKTKMGKRHVNTLLLNPICDINLLTSRYNNIEHYIHLKYDFDSILSGFKDLDKLLTKLKLKRLTPNDIFYLNDASTKIDAIINKLGTDTHFYDVLEIDKLLINHDSFKTYLHTTFNLSIAQQIQSLNFEKYEEFNHIFINSGLFPKLDEQVKHKLESKDKLFGILNYLESCFIKKGKDKTTNNTYIKQHQPSSSELCLIITKKRTQLLREYISKYNNKQEYEEEETINQFDKYSFSGTNKQPQIKNEHIQIEFVSSFSGRKEYFYFNLDEIYFKDYNKTSNYISSPTIDKLIHNIFNNGIAFQSVLLQTYQCILEHIYNNYFDYIVNCVNTIKTLDMYNNFATITKIYNLTKPNILNNRQDKSYISTSKLRHILIENIEKNELYIPNDIELGTDDDNQGMLLFGTNAVGKTSLIKAIGIAVIMAQSGCFVPCERFDFYPYKYIFTRIIGNDNIFKGLSTFGVEMSELRVILNNCNSNSLVLGDELCSGTEIDSALAIFLSSLETLTRCKSTFIFATHFHEITRMKELDELKSIKLKHMKVVFNNETNKLVYDRRLHDGSGESIYGLEVCKSLRMPEDFIENCYKIRNNYNENKNNVLLMKKSKYNKNKLRGLCEFCKKKMGSEIHHLHYQKDADDNSYIDNTFHKNHTANLASICEACHDHIHSLNLVFERRKTIDGGYEFILKQK